MRFFAALLAAVFAFSVLGAGTAPPAEAKKRTTAAAVAEDAQAIAVLNAYRKSKGLGAVALDPGLSKMALSLVTACVKARGCDHNTGGSFQQRAAKFGYKNIYGAENLMIGGTTIDQAFAWWKASKVHEGNMRLKQATRAGFARLPGSGAAFWVLILTSDPM